MINEHPFFAGSVSTDQVPYRAQGGGLSGRVWHIAASEQDLGPKLSADKLAAIEQEVLKAAWEKGNQRREGTQPDPMSRLDRLYAIEQKLDAILELLRKQGDEIACLAHPPISTNQLGGALSPREELELARLRQSEYQRQQTGPFNKYENIDAWGHV